MSVRRIKAGSTDVSVTLRIVDSTDGTPETGVVFNTSGIDLWYRREGAASVDITEATLAALTTAHTDGGFLHINDGWYRLDLPDAACATGVAGVQIGGTVTGMVVLAPYIELDVNTAEDVYTRIGAPAGASVSADIADIEGKVDDLESRLGTPSDLGSGATVAANLVDIESQTDDIGVAGAGLTNINLPDQTMNITGNITGNLSGSVGSVTGAVGSVTGNVGGDVAGSVGSLAAQAKTDVNAEVVDALNTDTYAEPGQGAPAATTTLVAKIGYLYKFLRNKVETTSTQISIYDDAGTTVDQKSTISDDATTFTRGEFGSGP